MCSVYAAEKRLMKQAHHMTAHVHVSVYSVLTWTAQCWLRWHAAAVWLQADLSSFLMRWEQLQLPHLSAGWLENLICLSDSRRERERERLLKWREREGRGREKQREVLLSGHWMDTFCFRCDSMTDSNTPFSPAFFSSFFPFPHFSAWLSSYFGTRLSFSIFFHIEWLYMLSSSGPKCYYWWLLLLSQRQKNKFQISVSVTELWSCECVFEDRMTVVTMTVSLACVSRWACL